MGGTLPVQESVGGESAVFADAGQKYRLVFFFTRLFLLNTYLNLLSPKGGHHIFEDPGGTGKTPRLVVGALAWCLHTRRHAHHRAGWIRVVIRIVLLSTFTEILMHPYS